MRTSPIRLGFGLLALAGFFLAGSLPAEEDSPIAMVIHGGAGTIRPENLSQELEAQYRAKLEEALKTGYAVLQTGGTSLDAVEMTIRLMEDSPLFNAGKGAVFTAAGRNELDASIMEGHTLNAGAVAGVTTLKNPITAARAVMEKTPHVLLAGRGAEAFAHELGLEEVEPEYFFTQRRWDALEKAREKAREEAQRATIDSGKKELAVAEGSSSGTVGAVALDRHGHLAAGTSTGGMTFKKHGRVGDSPLIGAGTFANAECGVSATGHGEFFIRHAVAFDICARLRYQGLSITDAASQVVLQDLVAAGGAGGVIALDRKGQPAQVFNTLGMYRGFVDSNGKTEVAIYKK